MTDPDERRNRLENSSSNRNIPSIAQPNFGAILAAQIPQVEIPDDLDALRQFLMPLIPPAPIRRRGRLRQTTVTATGADQINGPGDTIPTTVAAAAANQPDVPENAIQPLWHDPPRHIDFEAIQQEHQRRDQELIQQMQNVWRNQLEMWQDQLEMQQDRDKLQRQRQRHESHLLDQMHRLGVVADNMSSDRVEEY